MNVKSFGGNFLGHSKEMKLEFAKVHYSAQILDEFGKVIEALKNETVDIFNVLQQNPESPSHRRQAIKSIFSWFEGQSYLMKQIAFDRYEHYPIEFSTADLVMLREQEMFLDKNGEAQCSETNYQEFLSNYIFAFKCFAKAHGTFYNPKEKQIDQLRKLKSVRNRLTHPKSYSSLEVSDSDIKLAKAVLNWHMSESNAIFDVACHAKLPARWCVPQEDNSLDATLPTLLFWKNGEVYEFNTKSEAERFALAKGGKIENLDFCICSESD